MAQTRRLLLGHFGNAFPTDEFVAAWVRHFDLMASTRLSLTPGAIELLDTLDDLRLPRAIATSSAHHTVAHHLTAHDLVGRFHEIVGHGDYVSSRHRSGVRASESRIWNTRRKTRTTP